MSLSHLWFAFAVIGALALLIWARRFRGIGREIQTARARESFRLQRERLERMVLEKASAGGTPRGLRWLECSFTGETEFAREIRTSRIVAIVGVVVRFEAIEGGDMEGLPAVPLPRTGSALLHFDRGEWSTSGRVIFNLSPLQVIHRFAADYELMAQHHH